MIKGLAITPPVLGRISIGRLVERNGKRLPEKNDQLTITTQVQNKDGWIVQRCLDPDAAIAILPLPIRRLTESITCINFSDFSCAAVSSNNVA